MEPGTVNAIPKGGVSFKITGPRTFTIPSIKPAGLWPPQKSEREPGEKLEERRGKLEGKGVARVGTERHTELGEKISTYLSGHGFSLWSAIRAIWTFLRSRGGKNARRVVALDWRMIGEAPNASPPLPLRLSILLSFILALVLKLPSSLHTWAPYLVPGRSGVIFLVALRPSFVFLLLSAAQLLYLSSTFFPPFPVFVFPGLIFTRRLRFVLTLL